MKAQRKQTPVAEVVNHDTERLMVRIDPVTGESPLGYLCRISGVFRYDKANWLDGLLGYHIPQLDIVKGQDALKTSHILRLHPDEWRETYYERSYTESRSKYCRFLGQPIRLDRLNLTRPRVCPDCLREHEVCLAIWDLALVAVCPIHHRYLVNDCWKCSKPLRWSRHSITQCQCGADLRSRVGPPVDAHIEAINATLYQAAGVRNGAQIPHVNTCGFPPELNGLSLNSLATLISFLGTMGQGKHMKQTAYIPTSLESTTQLVRNAGAVLANWPSGFHDCLSRMRDSSSQFANAVTFKNAFGNHFPDLIGLGEEFVFLRNAFEQFVMVKWPGVVRKQHRLFSESFRSQYPWVTAQEAMHIANVAVPRLISMVHSGALEGKFVNPQRGSARTECWIWRSSLDSFVSRREKEYSQYLPQSEAAAMLGLSIASIAHLGLCGVIPVVDGLEKKFPKGKYYEKRTIEKLTSLCRSHWGRGLHIEGSKTLISLESALHNMLGGRETLPNIFSNVLNGTLVPVGHTSTSASHTSFKDLVFRRSDLRKYAKPVEWKSLPVGFTTQEEAARKLKTNTEVIRNLAAKKLLFSPAGRFNRFRIVSLDDVESFVRTYICIRALADQFNTRSDWVARYLHNRGVRVLAIGLPGKGKKLFVKRVDATGIVIPPAQRARLGNPRESSNNGYIC